MSTPRICGVESCEELEMLRSHVLSLEQERKRQTEVRRESAQLGNALRERSKELHCIYAVAELIERHEDSLDKILQGIVELLPGSWQYPEIACARILFKGRSYQTTNFKASRWKQEARISAAGQQLGTVEVAYLKKQPTLDEGPFLCEERSLLNALSVRIVKTAEKIATKQQLQTERQSLHDANAALHGALVRIQQEKKMIGNSIQANIDKIVLPILFALKSGLDAKQSTYATLLEKNLTSIVEPFVGRSQASLSSLSPVELLICNMIKHGLPTKEIAEIRGISPDTVNRHREHIRSKLGLTNSKSNLVTYLNNLPLE